MGDNLQENPMLTKSDFHRFLECPNEFWLDANFPYSESERSLSDNHRREEGYELQRLAASLTIFAARDGILVEPSKTFETTDLFARSDFVVTDLSTNEIDIYEVKATSSPDREKHLYDVGFQAHVARKAGYDVRNIFLVTCNKGYVRNGDIDCEGVLQLTGLTSKEADIAEEITERIQAALICHEAEPEAALVNYCSGRKLDCRFIRHHFKDIPDFNVAHVFGRSKKKLDELLALGILELTKIPPETKPTTIQQKIIDVYCSQQPYIDADSIRSELKPLEYPLHFLDYEAFGYAIPLFDGLGPYEPVLFQYSLHIVREAGAEPEAIGYLSKGDNGHPAREVAEHLRNNFLPEGSVLVWNKAYEKRSNEITARIFDDYAAFFTDVTNRMYDLRDIFQKQYYIHPATKGRDSIKAVLPALFPDDPAYKDLGIGEGNDASILWYHMTQRRGGDDACTKIYEDLCEYCALDTFAMVKIYNFLAAI